MNYALQKTISLLLLIVIGLFLKKKIKHKEQLGGVKVLILSIALPATIFVALLKINIEPGLLVFPVLALAFNGLMFLAARYALPWFGVDKNGPEYRSLLMLVASLAPGLSCFPFLMEYLGEEALAHAALADVGNKVFVLIILYMLAMSFYYKRINQGQSEAEMETGKDSRLKSLLISLINEPVNLVIVSALVLLAFGLNLESLPGFLQDAALRMSALMTPMVLLFIGMAVKFKKSEFGLIVRVLLWRSGLAFLMSGVCLLIVPSLAPATALLLVVFPQSSVSFWPFAHMSAIAGMEQGKEQGSTFNLDLALNVLALSLPFSTIIILSICSIGSFFAQPSVVLILGAALFGAGMIPVLIKQRKRVKKTTSEPKKHLSSTPQFELQK